MMRGRITQAECTAEQCGAECSGECSMGNGNGRGPACPCDCNKCPGTGFGLGLDIECSAVECAETCPMAPCNCGTCGSADPDGTGGNEGEGSEEEGREPCLATCAAPPTDCDEFVAMTTSGCAATCDPEVTAPYGDLLGCGGGGGGSACNPECVVEYGMIGNVTGAYDLATICAGQSGGGAGCKTCGFCARADAPADRTDAPGELEGRLPSGPLRRGPSVIAPPPFSFVWRIPIRGTNRSDE
jgi:hypothetical protein